MVMLWNQHSSTELIKYKLSFYKKRKETYKLFVTFEKQSMFPKLIAKIIDIQLSLIIGYTFFQGNNYFIIFIVFSNYCLSPFYPPIPHSHHTVAHVHESFFFFAQSLHPQTHTTKLSSCSPSMRLSLLCLLVQFSH